MKINRSELKALVREVLEEGPMKLEPRPDEKRRGKADWYRVVIDDDYDVIVPDGGSWGSGVAAIKDNIQKKFKRKVTGIKKLKKIT